MPCSKRPKKKSVHTNLTQNYQVIAKESNPFNYISRVKINIYSLISVFQHNLNSTRDIKPSNF